MLRKIMIALGGVGGVALLVLGLWIWRNNEPLALRFAARNGSLTALALRSLAVAAAALGEGLLVVLVLANLWRRDRVTRFLGLSSALVFLLSTTAAVALGLAGR
jgi:hypothetical protein